MIVFLFYASSTLWTDRIVGRVLKASDRDKVEWEERKREGYLHLRLSLKLDEILVCTGLLFLDSP